jgi:hypothetical protein
MTRGIIMYLFSLIHGLFEDDARIAAGRTRPVVALRRQINRNPSVASAIAKVAIQPITSNGGGSVSRPMT